MNNSFHDPAKLISPLAIVVCDAGAANLIAAWGPILPKPLFVCASGPAVQIMRQASLVSEFVALEDAISQSCLVLTGTGWSSSLEHDARRYAKNSRVPTLAVIDHWVNYRARFIRDEEEVLPDCIIVTDDYAECIARNDFQGHDIVQWPNHYLDAELSKIRAYTRHERRTPPEKILMVMEPARAIWPGDQSPGEFVAATRFLFNLYEITGNDKPVEIRIRPHPADPPGKYVALVKEHAAIPMVMSEDTALSEDIAWADWVVGCESFALVVALAAGVPTMSILPPHAPPCRLPHRELQHLNDWVI